MKLKGTCALIAAAFAGLTLGSPVVAADSYSGIARVACADGYVFASPTTIVGTSGGMVTVALAFTDPASNRLEQPPISITVDSIANDQSTAAGSVSLYPTSAGASTDATGYGNTGYAQAGQMAETSVAVRAVITGGASSRTYDIGLTCSGNPTRASVFRPSTQSVHVLVRVLPAPVVTEHPSGGGDGNGSGDNCDHDQGNSGNPQHQDCHGDGQGGGGDGGNGAPAPTNPSRRVVLL